MINDLLMFYAWVINMICSGPIGPFNQWIYFYRQFNLRYSEASVVWVQSLMWVSSKLFFVTSIFLFPWQSFCCWTTVEKLWQIFFFFFFTLKTISLTAWFNLKLSFHPARKELTHMISEDQKNATAATNSIGNRLKILQHTV